MLVTLGWLVFTSFDAIALTGLAYYGHERKVNRQ